MFKLVFKNNQTTTFNSLEEMRGFLGITEEEWIKRTNVNKDNTENDYCSITTFGSEEIECMPGDIEFIGWEDATLPESVCNRIELKDVTLTA